MSKTKITAAVERITPEQAAQYLKKNEWNRTIREDLVDHYARQIKNDEWMINGETVIFSGEGSLLNGQHRLSGIVKAKKAAETVVVRGVEKKAMVTIDTGRSRSVADHLKMQGIVEKARFSLTDISAAITYSCKFINGKYIDHRQRVSPQQAFKFLDDNKGFLKLVVSDDLFPKTISKKTIVTRSVYIALRSIFSKIDPSKSEEFWYGLMTGEKLSSSSPILACRRRLEQLFAINKRLRRDQRAAIYYTITAFTLFLEGKKADFSSLKYTDGVVIELPKKRGGVKG